MQDPNIDVLLRGSHMRGRSSLEICWTGLTLERRVAPAAARDEATIDFHYMILWGDKPIVVERDYRPGRFTRLVKQPGTLSIGAAGRLPAVRPETPYDVVACLIDPAALERHILEDEEKPGAVYFEHLGVEDRALAQLVNLCALETFNGGENGQLYRDALGSAIMSRFLRVARTENPTPKAILPLPKHRLQLVVQKITDEYYRDINLSDLAGVSGYSKSHFLRMFRSATGKTPYRFLQDVRLDRALEALSNGSSTLAQIAASVGFSSHSHLTRLFIKRFNATPSQFRRK